jgi:poly-gamma-glutamate synthesis protein (capsule biosynthesis protein)
MKVLTVGDFCPQNRVAELFDKGEYKTVLDSVKKVISNVDYSIVNFECPVTKGGEKPIEKCGPNLQCSEKGLEAVKWAGFDCVTLANNHFLDYGKEGVEHTLEVCEKYGVDTVGGGMNLHEASKILYKEIEDKTLAIINCCEHEFSIATEETAGSNPLNPIQQYYDIKEARMKADYLLVIVHGGHEHYQLPSPRMQETYRFFVDAGADAVVNHHQHCFSGYEYYKGKPIVYGLGNFCFDKQGYFEGLWEYGYMVMIDFANDIEMTILPYQQCKENPQIEFLKDTGSFDEKIQELNNIISSKDELNRHTKSYYSKQLQSVSLAFEPYRGRVLSKLYLKGWLPSFLRKGKLVKLRNMIENESHRDKTLFFLTN